MGRPRDELTHAILAAVAQGPATPREIAARAVSGLRVTRERCCYLARIGVLQRVGRGPKHYSGAGKPPHIFALAPKGQPSAEEVRAQAAARLGATLQAWRRG